MGGRFNIAYMKSTTGQLLACVASVSLEQRATERGFWHFAHAKIGARAKIAALIALFIAQ